MQTSVVLLLVGLPLTLMAHKVHQGGYDLKTLVPVETYRVTLNMSVAGHGDSVRVRTFLPQPDARITIRDERLHADLPGFSERYLEGNRIAEWSGLDVWGERSIRVEYTAFATALAYEIDPQILIPAVSRGDEIPHLQATATIEADHPEIGVLAEQLAPAGSPLVEGLRAIHEYCRSLKGVSFKGTTDALTALRLGEASCNGKSRLFAALARHQGIPTRLVGGLILENGVKRTSHQWVEVLVGSHWVPFCPTNDHFATIPASYLPLYWDDMVLFAHTKDINFDYRFRIKREFGIRAELVAQGVRDPLNLMSIWNTFAQAGIPADLLKVLLMIPLGVLVLVIFRNVIGIQPFGTFLPVLMAVAVREIGMFWGLSMFLLLVLLIFSIRLSLKPLNLLHLPQMAILLTFTIIFILSLGVIGVRAGNVNLAHVGMFPLAILAITTERFALMIEEEGFLTTARVTLMTVVAIAACFLVMNATTFQILFLTFPELVLVVVFFDIWIGHWMGLRLLEYWRFRSLIAGGWEGRHA